MADAVRLLQREQADIDVPQHDQEAHGDLDGCGRGTLQTPLFTRRLDRVDGQNSRWPEPTSCASGGSTRLTAVSKDAARPPSSAL